MKSQIEQLFKTVHFRYETKSLKLDMTEFMNNLSGLLQNIQVMMPKPEEPEEKQDEVDNDVPEETSVAKSDVAKSDVEASDVEESDVAVSDEAAPVVTPPVAAASVIAESDAAADGNMTPDEVDGNMRPDEVDGSVSQSNGDPKSNVDPINTYFQRDVSEEPGNEIKFSITVNYNNNQFSYKDIANFIDQTPKTGNTYTFTYANEEISPQGDNQLAIESLIENDNPTFNRINITYTPGEPNTIILEFIDTNVSDLVDTGNNADTPPPNLTNTPQQNNDDKGEISSSQLKIGEVYEVVLDPDTINIDGYTGNNGKIGKYTEYKNNVRHFEENNEEKSVFYIRDHYNTARYKRRPD
jgi:hypothetical protein